MQNAVLKDLFSKGLTQQEIVVKYNESTNDKVSYRTLKAQFDRLSSDKVESLEKQHELNKSWAVNVSSSNMTLNLADSVVLASCHQGHELFGAANPTAHFRTLNAIPGHTGQIAANLSLRNPGGGSLLFVTFQHFSDLHRYRTFF